MTNIRGKSEAVTDFISLDSKITAYGECSHGIKRRFLLGRKATTNLDSVLKSRDITWPLKVHIVKAMIFSTVMQGCESSTIKKGWVPKNWYFRTAVLVKCLRVPWTARSNQSILQESPEYSGLNAEAEALILWPPDGKSQLIGKDPHAGKTEGERRRGWQRMRWLDSITDLMDMNWSELWERVLQIDWRVAVYGVTKSQTQLSDWTTTN